MLQVPEFMGTNGFTWFIGVVEDIADPLQNGRVRVRIYGFHSENPNELPTEALPWAIHLKPVTGGTFMAPSGLLPGTTVVGFFADGPVGQYPIIIGVINAINARPGSSKNATSEQILANQAGGNSIIPGIALEDLGNVTGNQTVQFLGTLNEKQYGQLKSALGQKESSNNYTAVNGYGFIGKYQFGNAALYDLGYTASPTSSNSLLRNDANWKGKNGVNNLQIFLKNQGNCQETAMDELLQLNYNRMLKLGTITNVTPPKQLAGYLAVAHLLGAGGANKFYRGTDGRDANGTTGRSYYNLGYNSVTE
jgi:hypothetical protein